MDARDPRVDAYIVKASNFAIPILSYLREMVHEVCPEVTETIKWGFPNFAYKGRLVCSMAAFKQHCAFNLWFGAVLDDPDNLLAVGEGKESMGHLGRIEKMEDLPSPEILTRFIRESVVLIDAGAKKSPEKAPAPPKEVVVSDYFKEKMETSAAAQSHFNRFSPSQKREYLDWINEAKTDATRDKRMATALEWIAEGKIRNWKYIK